MTRLVCWPSWPSKKKKKRKKKEFHAGRLWHNWIRVSRERENYRILKGTSQQQGKLQGCWIRLKVSYRKIRTLLLGRRRSFSLQRPFIYTHISSFFYNTKSRRPRGVFDFGSPFSNRSYKVKLQRRTLSRKKKYKIIRILF